MSRQPPRAVHLTSAHQRTDTRILLKQCMSLTRHGWRVTLAVADGLGPGIVGGVEIEDVGPARSRVERMRIIPRRLLAAALKEPADVYQLHDPELLPVGVRLAKLGKSVIFDFHEDVPREILGKEYIPAPARVAVSRVYEWYERRASSNLAGLLAATPTIEQRLRQYHPRVAPVLNYPLLEELIPEVDMVHEPLSSPTHGTVEICYVGGISRLRGLYQMVDAMGRVRSDVILRLAGEVDDGIDMKALGNSPGSGRYEFLGFQDRDGVKATMRRSVAGLITLLPDPNFATALPVKMFEYMSAGIPVIASNFPNWSKIIDECKCGVCVDPTSPEQIAEAIDYLVENRDEAFRMGRNGRRAIEERYNWSLEESKLLSLYEDVVKPHAEL